MKSYNLIRYDLQKNIRTHAFHLLLIVFIGVYFFVSFYMDSVHTHWTFTTFHESVRNVRDAGVSLVDSLLYLTGGMLPLRNIRNIAATQYPIQWLVVQFVVLFFTSEYARSDLSGGGIQILSRIHSRTLWWIAKCIWNFLTILTCFIVLYLTWFILAACFHLPFALSIERMCFAKFFNTLPRSLQVSRSYFFLNLILLPILVCSSISLMQMTLSLYVKPVVAYLLSCIYCLAGMFIAHPLLLANYSMSVRSTAIGFYRFSPAVGLGLCLILMLLSIIIGIIHLSKMDLLDTAQMKYTRSWL